MVRPWRFRIAFIVAAAFVTSFVPSTVEAAQDKLRLPDKSNMKPRRSKTRAGLVIYYGGSPIPDHGSRTVQPDPTIVPIPNGRQTALVPSHTFGAGADQANGLADGTFEWLDPAFDRRNVNGRGKVAIGGEVTHDFNDFFGVWAGIHGVDTSLRFDREALDQFERTREGVEAFFTILLSGGVDRNVFATTEFDEPGGWRLGFAGGAEFGPERTFAGWNGFVRAGFDYLPGTAAAATGRLLLDYSFNSPGTGAPFHETDDVWVRSSREGAFGLLVGGGARRPFGDSLDFQVGLQATFRPNNLIVTVETNPSRVLGTPGGAVIFTPPAGVNQTIVMSNVASVASSVSVRQPETVTFEGSGIATNLALVFGVGKRF